jgi:hypothetical protein
MKKVADLAQLVAFILGLFSIVVLFLFVVNDAIPAIIDGRAKEFLPFIPLFFLVAYGYFMAWRRELSGSIMMLAGSSAIVLYFLTLPLYSEGALLFGTPFIASGFLMMFHWRIMYAKHKHHRRR